LYLATVKIDHTAALCYWVESLEW